MSRSSDFLKCFWDLAADDAIVRVRAEDSVLQHLRRASSDDLDYAVKRLVKGLCSSRASARLGFSACLALVLSTHEAVTTDEVLALCDDCTRISGSTKGMDERDLMFGKLFCYLALIRAGRLQSKETLMLLDRVLDLHSKRGWIKEVTVEALLLFQTAVAATSVAPVVLDRLAELVDEPLTELAAWQISLRLGLQPFLAEHPSIGVTLCKIDLLMNPEEHLDAISATLLAATAGFPKLHRVWDYLVGQIFGLDTDRQLPKRR
jgi:hypothetical protein